MKEDFPEPDMTEWPLESRGLPLHPLEDAKYACDNEDLGSWITLLSEAQAGSQPSPISQPRVSAISYIGNAVFHCSW